MSKDKSRVLSMLDQMIMSNTHSNATLVFLYDEVEKLFQETLVLQEDIEYFQDKVSRLQGDVSSLEKVREKAQGLLRALKAKETKQVRRAALELQAQLLIEPTKAPLDPNNTSIPFGPSKTKA